MCWNQDRHKRPEIGEVLGMLQLEQSQLQPSNTSITCATRVEQESLAPFIGLIKSSQKMLELKCSSSTNKGIAQPLWVLLGDLNTILEDEKSTIEKAVVNKIESIVTELIIVISSEQDNTNRFFKFRRLSSVLCARTVHLKLLSILQRLHKIILSLKLNKALQFDRIENFAEILTQADEKFVQALSGHLSTLNIEQLTEKSYVDEINRSELTTESGEIVAAEANSIITILSRAKLVFSNSSKNMSPKPVRKASEIIQENSKLINDLTKASVYMAECEEANIDYSDLKLLEVLGKGGFGIVLRANWRGGEVAVKTLSANSSDALSVSALAEFSSEISKWRKLRHPNIVPLLGTAYNRSTHKLCLIMELCEKSLNDLIYLEEQVPDFNTEWVCSIANDISSGLLYLHEAYIMHRDVKPRNILLVMSQGQKAPRAKLCDFGMAMVKQETGTIMQSSTGSVCGTPAYMAPETLGILSPVQLSFKSDLFAFGMVLFELIERRPPYENLNAIAITTSIMNGVRPTFSKRNIHPQWIYELVEMCWKHDRDERPTICHVQKMLELKKTSLSTDEINLLNEKQKKRRTLEDINQFDKNSHSVQTSFASTAFSSTDASGSFINHEKGDFSISNMDVDLEEQKAPAKYAENSKVGTGKEKNDSFRKRILAWVVAHPVQLLASIALLICAVVGITIGISLSGPGNDDPVKSDNTCQYASDFKGIDYCNLMMTFNLSTLDFECSANLCNLQTEDVEYPLLVFSEKTQSIVSNPNFPSCESSIIELHNSQNTKSSLFDILREQSFSSDKCPAPTTAMLLNARDTNGNVERFTRVGNIVDATAREFPDEESVFVFEEVSFNHFNPSDVSYRIKTVFGNYYLSAQKKKNGRVSIEHADNINRRLLAENSLSDRFTLHGALDMLLLEVENSGLFICLAKDGDVRVRDIDDQSDCSLLSIKPLNPESIAETPDKWKTTSSPATSEPTSEPPTKAPTTNKPVTSPTTKEPSPSPTLFPSSQPTTSKPTKVPTMFPSSFPSSKPTTSKPTQTPTTPIPTREPTPGPTHPTPKPTVHINGPSPLKAELTEINKNKKTLKTVDGTELYMYRTHNIAWVKFAAKQNKKVSIILQAEGNKPEDFDIELCDFPNLEDDGTASDSSICDEKDCYSCFSESSQVGADKAEKIEHFIDSPKSDHLILRVTHHSGEELSARCPFSVDIDYN